MRKTLVGLLAVGGMAVAANAQQINDPNTITLQHDFETDPPSAPPVGPFTLGNATFSENSGGTGGPGWRLISVFGGAFGRQLTDNAGITEMTIEFDTLMRKVGLNVGIGDATFNVDFLDAGDNVVGSVSGDVSGVAGNFFAGWESAGGIAKVVITEPSGENGRVGGIDDVRYEIIPAPGAFALLGLGGLAAARRRR